MSDLYDVERLVSMVPPRELGREDGNAVEAWMPTGWETEGGWAERAAENFAKERQPGEGRFRLVSKYEQFGGPRRAIEFTLSTRVEYEVSVVEPPMRPEPVVGSVDMSTVAEHEGDPS